MSEEVLVVAMGWSAVRGGELSGNVDLGGEWGLASMRNGGRSQGGPL